MSVWQERLVGWQLERFVVNSSHFEQYQDFRWDMVVEALRLTGLTYDSIIISLTFG